MRTTLIFWLNDWEAVQQLPTFPIVRIGAPGLFSSTSPFRLPGVRFALVAQRARGLRPGRVSQRRERTRFHRRTVAYGPDCENLERAVNALKDNGHQIDDNVLGHLWPLGWEHINLTGDYVWRQNRRVDKGRFRPLRIVQEG